MKIVKRCVRHFESFDEYNEYYENHEHRSCITDIVENNEAKLPNTVADAEYDLKSWQAAVKKLAKATGWDWILGELECDDHYNYFLPDCDSVSIEFVDEDRIYIAARQYK